jgi:dTDP-4-dehydrorhamnose 3,5-epimerase
MMIFNETKLKGAYIIELEKHGDDRGFFARTWCRKEFEDHGLVSESCQENLSLSLKKGTLRGMHYQVGDSQETKLVRCSKGALYDVIVDVRPESSSFKQWIGVELTEDNYRMLYVPRGFAHGILTLCDNAVASYLVSQFYSPGDERGARYNDPSFGIEWPVPVEVISDKDNSWDDFQG